MKRFPVRPTILFAALAAASVILAAAGARLTSGFEQMLLVSIGSSILGGGLTFFLVEMFR